MDLTSATGEEWACVYPLRLWAWCGKHARSGRIIVQDPINCVERVAGWKGERGRLYRALLKDFLAEADGAVEVRGWSKRYGAALSKAERAAERKRAQRQRDMEEDRSVTSRVTARDPSSSSLSFWKTDEDSARAPEAAANPAPQAEPPSVTAAECHTDGSVTSHVTAPVGHAPVRVTSQAPERDVTRDKSALPADIGRLPDIWNEFAPPELPRWVASNLAERKLMLAWFERAEPLKDWEAAVKRLNSSSWARGLTPKPFKAKPSWLLKAENAAKVLNGEYDDFDRADESVTGHTEVTPPCRIPGCPGSTKDRPAAQVCDAHFEAFHIEWEAEHPDQGPEPSDLFMWCAKHGEAA